MDEELSNLILQGSRRALLEARLYEAKSRFSELTRYAHNGGIFQITSELLLEINRMIDREVHPWVILDHYGLPVEISNLKKLRTDLERKFTSAKRRFSLDVEEARQTAAPTLFDA